MTDRDTHPLLPASEAAAALGTTLQTLANWRATGRYSLPYVKVGRLVRYRSADLQAFITSRTISPPGDL